MGLRHLRSAVSASFFVCVCSEWLALEGGKCFGLWFEVS